MNTIEKIIVDRYLSIVLGLLPVALISGPLIPEIIIGFINIISLIQFKKKKILLLENFYFKFFLFICAFILLRNFFSDYFDKNFSTSFFYFRFGLFAYSIYLLFLYDRFLKSILFYGILISYLVLAIDSSYEYLYGDRLIGNKSIYQDRISSFFGDEYIMGSYVVRLLPFILFLFLWIKTEEKFKKLYISLIIILAAFLIILSGERTALGLFIFIIFSIFLCEGFKNYLISFLFFFVILLFLFFQQNSNIKERYLGLGKYMNIQNNEFVFFTPEHHSMMLTSIKIFKDNIFFGHGGKSFKYLCKKEKYKTITYPQGDTNKNPDIGCSTHPHNIILQIIVEYGIIGLLIYLFIITNVFLNFWKNILLFKIKKNKINENIYLSNIFLYLSMLANLLPFLPSGNIFNNWLSILIFLPIGFIIKIKKK